MLWKSKHKYRRINLLCRSDWITSLGLQFNLKLILINHKFKQNSKWNVHIFPFFKAFNTVLRIHTTLHRIQILLESDPKSIYFIIFFYNCLFVSKLTQDFYSKIILDKNWILPYYTFLAKSLLSENLLVIFWWFWSMFYSLRILIRNTALIAYDRFWIRIRIYGLTEPLEKKI